MSIELRYRLSVEKGRDGTARCSSLAKDSINLSPKLIVRTSQPPRVQTLRLEMTALPQTLHRPKYSDQSLSDWMPFFHIADTASDELTDVPSPLPSPLREVAELLRQNMMHWPQAPEEVPLAPGVTVPSLFELAPQELPTWARDELHHQLHLPESLPADSPVSQLGKLIATKFIGPAVTVTPLRTGEVVLLGEPYELHREGTTATPNPEAISVFPVVTLDSSFRIKRVELRTSGLRGAGCEQSLPSVEP
ncbi:hypothetical protein JGU66_29470 [Myxococcaceae bacterium JPH2]|nr:hypothetical protein [Myxococcaceae bacterium JPH2]